MDEILDQSALVLSQAWALHRAPDSPARDALLETLASDARRLVWRVRSLRSDPPANPVPELRWPGGAQSIEALLLHLASEQYAAALSLVCLDWSAQRVEHGLRRMLSSLRDVERLALGQAVPADTAVAQA